MTAIGWAIKWRDAKGEYLMGAEPGPGTPTVYTGYTTMVFRYRRQALEYIKIRYGYLKSRPDLKRAPHGWKMPIAVKVRVTVEEIGT